MRRKSSSNSAKLKSPPQQECSIPLAQDAIDRLFKKVNKMRNDDLEMLLLSKDNFVVDCLLKDHIPRLEKLEHERDALRTQVKELSDCNYAREPEFVQARLKLRETLDDVAAWKRRVTGKHLNSILEKLNMAQAKLAGEAKSFEEKSERIAKEFLSGTRNYDEFIRQYVELRQESSLKTVLADKLAKYTSSKDKKLL